MPSLEKILEHGLTACQIKHGLTPLLATYSGGVEDTKLEATAKDTKKFEAKDRNARGQGQKPRTQMQVFFYEKVS